MNTGTLVQNLTDYLNDLGPQAAIPLFVAAVLCVYLAIKNDNHRTLFAFYVFFAACLLMVAIYILVS